MCCIRDSIPKPIFTDKNMDMNENGSFNKITGDELFKYFQNQSYLNKLRKIIIIDVRYNYEFKGGRIIGAKNIQTIDELKKLYKRFKDQGNSIGIIFHCEYSHDRSPKVMNLFRNYDRESNKYPNLSFPNIFLLEGGYKEFYKRHSDLCCGGYTPMRDIDFIKSGELKRCTSYFRMNMLQETKSSKMLHHTVPFSSDIMDIAYNNIGCDLDIQ